MRYSQLLILGISAYYHDSACCLIKDGEIVAAVQEERFSRIKHDPSFPTDALEYVLQSAGIKLSQVDYIVYYEKPWIKFERLIETYLAYSPRGLRSFLIAMPIWLTQKFFIEKTMKKELAKFCDAKTFPKMLLGEHHRSHAASAFYASPFSDAAILCVDGVGEWATASLWHGEENRLEQIWEIRFPHSLGLLYSAFTYFTGFTVNSGEYKLMGLAPYGEPKYVELIERHLIDIKPDGSFRLNMEYFGYASGLTMTNKKFNKLFGREPRTPESELTQSDMDLARSIQVVVENIVLKLTRSARRELGCVNLCLAGGVALNCVANGKILKDGSFDQLWIQPAAGDAGGALGAALCVYHEYLGEKRIVSKDEDFMKGSYLGPEFDQDEIRRTLDSVSANYRNFADAELFEVVAQYLASEKVVGWFQGRAEFGPRALGNRSILADARVTDMQSTLNHKIKYREGFRPFAPAVTVEKMDEWFDLKVASPYMLFVSELIDTRRVNHLDDDIKLQGLDRLHLNRSQIPAVTHVDFTARVQSVDSRINPRFHRLIQAFEKTSGCPVLVNTSFNIRGEPIVNTPLDAFKCFMRTEMDVLVVGNYVLVKPGQSGDDFGKFRSHELRD